MPTRIAIIEDEDTIANMYRFKFEKEGYTVRMASNGIDGITLIEDFKPEVVLLDLRMPGMNGDEMLQKVRATQWGSNVRVIILTNISKDEAPHNLRLLNVDRYIVKAHHTPSQVLQITKEIIDTE